MTIEKSDFFYHFRMYNKYFRNLKMDAIITEDILISQYKIINRTRKNFVVCVCACVRSRLFLRHMGHIKFCMHIFYRVTLNHAFLQLLAILTLATAFVLLISSQLL